MNKLSVLLLTETILDCQASQRDKSKKVGFGVWALLNYYCFAEKISLKQKIRLFNLKVIRDFPEDLQKFSEIKDRFLSEEDNHPYKLLKLNCFSCKKLGHLVLDCPILHYKPDKEKIIKSHLFSLNQARNSNYHDRFQERNLFLAQRDQALYQEVAEIVQNEYWKDMQQYEIEDVEQSKSLKNQSPESSDDEIDSNEAIFKSRSTKIIPTIVREEYRSCHTPQMEGSKYSQRQSRMSITGVLTKSRSRHSIIPSLSPIHQMMISPMEQNKSQDELVLNNRESDSLAKSESLKIQVDETSLEQQQNKQKEEEQQQQQPLEDQNQKKVESLLKSVLKNRSQTLKNDQIEDQNEKKLKVASKLDKIQKVKVKFQKAFEFVTKMNQVKRTRNQSQKFHEENTLQHQVALENKKFKWNQFQSVVYKQKHKKRFMTQKEQEQIDFLHLKMKWEMNEKESIDIFEHAMQYKFYFVKNNLDEVLKDNEIEQEVIKSQKYSEFFQKMVRYMLYPYDYINIYKKVQKQPTKRRVSVFNKIPTDNKFKKQIRAYQEVLKVRNKVKETIKNRNKIVPAQTSLS